MRKSHLRRRIIHHHDVSHSCCCGSAADALTFNDCRPQPALCALQRAGRAHNARPDDDHIPDVAHTRMPARNGSPGLKISRLSAVINAVPVMLGMSSPSRS